MIFLRIRSWPNGRADVWLVEKDGQASAAYLHGECLIETAERLAEKLGVKVEREEGKDLPRELF